MNNSNVLYKCFTYWPDGTWKEAPKDGFVYQSTQTQGYWYNPTYTWDGFLESWADARGKLVDFAPQGMPSKMYELDDQDPITFGSAKNVPTCDCGARHTQNPNCHAHWCQTQEKSL